jgi:hypothetical protein
VCRFPGLYDTQWYNGDPMVDADIGYIRGYDRVVGGIELRQMRVGPDSCKNRRFTSLGNRYDTKDGSCYAEFTELTESKKSFGPAGEWCSHEPAPSLAGLLPRPQPQPQPPPSSPSP